jgi:hypothetical protein
MIRTFLRSVALVIALQLSGLPLAVTAVAATPEIQHEPVKVAPRGKAKTIIARVSSGSGAITTVNLFLTQSADASPVKIEMKPSGAPGTYFGTIPAAYLQSKGTIRYYIEALAADGEWKETNWMSIAVQDEDQMAAGGNGDDAGPSVPPPGESGGKPGWFWPTVLIGGGALAVAGAVALSDSGGGDDPAPLPDPGDDDVAGRIITRTVRDDVEATTAVLPKDTVVDITGQLNGREIETVRVDLTLDPVDGLADSAVVVYNGNNVLETGQVVNSVSRTVTLSASSPVVVIRAATSTLDDQGNQNYSITATVTYILKKK